MGFVGRFFLFLSLLALVSCAQPYVGRCFLGACNSTSPSSNGSTPTAASGLAVTTVSPSEIDLTWTDNSSDETGFIIERRAGSGAWTEVATVAAGSTSYSDTGLDPLTAYSYRITAKGTGGNASASSTSVALTQFDNSGSWSDTFNTIDTTFWTQSSDATTSVDNKLQITHPASGATQGLVSNFILTGDFDITMDYSDVSIPACAYAAVGMGYLVDTGGGNFNSLYNIERRYSAGTHNIFTDNGADTWVNGFADPGKLRIKRVGGNVTTYQSDGVTPLSTEATSVANAKILIYGRDDGFGCSSQMRLFNLTLQ